MFYIVSFISLLLFVVSVLCFVSESRFNGYGEFLSGIFLWIFATLALWSSYYLFPKGYFVNWISMIYVIIQIIYLF